MEPIPVAATATAATLPQVPSSKGNRPWKKQKDKPVSRIRGVSSFKPSWEQRLKQREKRKALMAVVTAAREADGATKEAERKRRAAKKKRKEENELRSAQKVVISNPKKLAKMSKKQFLRTVHLNK